MSSLSAAQADGYYIPPAYLESGQYKKQSLNQFAGSKGHNQYLQRSVVRFELPYDGFCLGCDAHVGKGTRFNAHKAHVDDYFTTKIWEFTMTCRACARATFKIRTDPKERGFSYDSGIKRKVEEFDVADAGTAGVIDTDLGNGIQESGGLFDHVSGGAAADVTKRSDPLAKLEKKVLGERKAMSEHDQMEALIKISAGTMWDDAASNAALRSAYRSSRKAKKRRLKAAASAGLGKGIEIADATEEDAFAAHSAFRNGRVRDEAARKRERRSFSKLRAGSIFDKETRSHCSAGAGQKRKPTTRDPKPQSMDSNASASKSPKQANNCGSRLKAPPKLNGNDSAGIEVSKFDFGNKRRSGNEDKVDPNDADYAKSAGSSSDIKERNTVVVARHESALAALTAYSSDSE